MRKPKIYSKSEKAKLLSVVGDLIVTLGRPVCSDDLIAHFRKSEAETPFYIQRWGQVLFKAAKSRPHPVPYLRRIGLIRNRAYYALEDSEAMRSAFEIERRRHRIAEALAWRMADYVEFLIGGDHDEIARHAAAGFVAEFGRGAEGKMRDEVARLRKVASPEFVPIEPSDLINRTEAVAILRAAAQEAHQDEERVAHLQINKCIASWAWSQSSLFEDRKGLVYSARQIRLLAAAKFQVDAVEEYALLACSRFITTRGGDNESECGSEFGSVLAGNEGLVRDEGAYGKRGRLSL